ncbi:MAG TPA: ferric reductase-like transmembrane domain-containing protein [Bryobacteraceae bacterium]|nr:ferric reductase-like transmembrane domain-containing protein [Bryobacteraceae bacterium]
MTAIDLSSFAGLTAMVLLTLNILLGLLVSVNYNPRRQWPRRKISLFQLHNWNGYLAMAVVCLHPVILWFSNDPKARFQVVDLAWPLHSPGQRLYNCLGAASFYAIALVVATSYFRPRLGYRTWKKLHYAAYFAAAVMFTHGLLIDPDLKGRPPDLLDGEKVLVEGCLATVAAASIWRWRYGSEKSRYRKRANAALTESV